MRLHPGLAADQPGHERHAKQDHDQQRDGKDWPEDHCHQRHPRTDQAKWYQMIGLEFAPDRFLSRSPPQNTGHTAHSEHQTKLSRSHPNDILEKGYEQYGKDAVSEGGNPEHQEDP